MTTHPINKAYIKNIYRDERYTKRNTQVRYWWVSQNKTAKEEIGNGFMWSPKTSKSGQRIQFYENMTLCKQGDLVFSFVKQHITNIGIVKSPAITTPKPFKTKEWLADGWRVDVEWQKTPNDLHPKSLINEIRPLLPGKYSPLKDNGEGNQVYLAEISHELAGFLLENLQLDKLDPGCSLDAENFSIERQEQDVIDDIEQDTNISDTEKETIIRARRGQGKYRKNLELIENHCRVTGITDKKFLIASHIKPWRHCASNQERLDGYNGLLLNHSIDFLFDKGYISFEDNGYILISENLPDDVRKRLQITPAINIGSLAPKQQVYLNHHRSNLFQKT